MTRLSWIFLLSVAACGGDDDDSAADSGMAMPDAGDDAGGEMDAGTDTGPVEQDAGTDAGEQGCTEGCDIVELQVGSTHVCARRENGEVLCWGGNRFGQLGDDRMAHGDCSDSGGGPEREDCTHEPVVVEDISADWITSRGGPNTCAGVDGELYCWGLDVIPPVGSDQRTRVFYAEAIEGFDSFSAASTSGRLQCVLTEAGGVQCRGDNEAGALGNGMFVESFDPVDVADISGVTELATGREHACIRDAEGVKCWGSDQNGQLGDGDMTLETCGPELQTFNCSGSAIEVTGLDATVTALSLGGQHSCAIMADETLMCWGANYAGQLGLGSSAGGNNVPVAVPGLTGVQQVALGADHTCVLLDGGDVQCFGRNDDGQVGDGADIGTHDTCTASATMVDCVLAPTDVDLPGPASQVAVGGFTSCALLVSGEVYCWGYNDLRQLGQEDRERRSTPVLVGGLD